MCGFSTLFLLLMFLRQQSRQSLCAVSSTWALQMVQNSAVTLTHCIYMAQTASWVQMTPRPSTQPHPCPRTTPFFFSRSLWTALNDDRGDYAFVIPARSLRECPCCVLNTQRRDYADPYMWCCGCIPPVRLNPICYRFGLKKRGAEAQGGGWRSVFMPYSTFHFFYIIRDQG